MNLATRLTQLEKQVMEQAAPAVSDFFTYLVRAVGYADAEALATFWRERAADSRATPSAGAQRALAAIDADPTARHLRAQVAKFVGDYVK